MMYAGKAWTHLIGTVLSFILLATVVGSDGGTGITVEEWAQVVVMGLGVVPIYLIPNTRYQGVAKGVIAGFVAIVALVPALLTGGIDGPEWIQLVLAFGTAAGVLVVPNSGDDYAFERQLASGPSPHSESPKNWLSE